MGMPVELAAGIPVVHNNPCIDDDEVLLLCWYHSDLGNIGENSSGHALHDYEFQTLAGLEEVLRGSRNQPWVVVQKTPCSPPWMHYMPPFLPGTCGCMKESSATMKDNVKGGSKTFPQKRLTSSYHFQPYPRNVSSVQGSTPSSALP